MLLLNPDKTEAVIFGTRQQLSTIDSIHGITIAGSSIHFSDAVKLLGARLDYCNSLLFVTSACNLDHLQRVQNTLARAVLQKPFSAHSTEL